MSDLEPAEPGPDENDEVVVPPEVLEVMPEDMREDPRMREVVMAALYRFEQRVESPVVPPQMLKAYDDVVPGAAELFFNEMKAQGEHRRELERKVVLSGVGRANRGQLLAGLIALVAIVGAIVIILAGKSLVGFGVLLSGLLPIVGAFLYSQRQQHRERLEKWREMEEPSQQEGNRDDDDT